MRPAEQLLEEVGQQGRAGLVGDDSGHVGWADRRCPSLHHPRLVVAAVEGRGGLEIGWVGEDSTEPVLVGVDGAL